MRIYFNPDEAVRNAIRAGFRPAWVELTTKSMETVNDMNA